MARLLALVVFAAGSLAAQWTPANAEWTRPVEPFRIAGNIYYVGTANVSAYLLTTSDGLVLLDTGFREAVPNLEENIRKLGLRPADIRLLITSHAHYDHVGGLAEIKAHTKARFLANPAEAPLFASGGKGDFAFGDKYLYPPVKPDGKLQDGEPVRLGSTVLTPWFTPGHTRGCTTWTTQVRDGGRTYNVVFPCSVSAPGYQLTGNEKYPNILDDFRASIRKLRALPCDIFLSLHSWDFDLPAKMKALGEPGNPFVDPDGYRRYLDKAEAALPR